MAFLSFLLYIVSCCHYFLCHNSQNTAYSDIEIYYSFQYGERKLAEHKSSKVSTDEYGWHCIAP